MIPLCTRGEVWRYLCQVAFWDCDPLCIRERNSSPLFASPLLFSCSTVFSRHLSSPLLPSPRIVSLFLSSFSSHFSSPLLFCLFLFCCPLPSPVLSFLLRSPILFFDSHLFSSTLFSFPFLFPPLLSSSTLSSPPFSCTLFFCYLLLSSLLFFYLLL